VLDRIEYKNKRSHRTFSLAEAQPLISYIEFNYEANKLFGDPFDFDSASARYSAGNDKVTLEV
jgi:hypothetical protein